MNKILSWLIYVTTATTKRVLPLNCGTPWCSQRSATITFQCCNASFCLHKSRNEQLYGCLSLPWLSLRVLITNYHQPLCFIKCIELTARIPVTIIMVCQGASCLLQVWTDPWCLRYQNHSNRLGRDQGRSWRKIIVFICHFSLWCTNWES